MRWRLSISAFRQIVDQWCTATCQVLDEKPVLILHMWDAIQTSSQRQHKLLIVIMTMCARYWTSGSLPGHTFSSLSFTIQRLVPHSESGLHTQSVWPVTWRFSGPIRRWSRVLSSSEPHENLLAYSILYSLLLLQYSWLNHSCRSWRIIKDACAKSNSQCHRHYKMSIQHKLRKHSMLSTHPHSH